MYKRQRSEFTKIDLIEIFFELLNHWKMILLSTILMGAIVYVGSKYLITPQYESTSQLYVLSNSTSITMADLQLGSTLTDDYMVLINSRPVLEQVISNLKLDESYGTLMGKIMLENPTNSRILKITVRDSSPKEAKKIADELACVASAYIAEKMDQDPPSILQYGYADGGPVSPNIWGNTMKGALVGACLAIGMAFLIDMLNDTIMDADDVEKKLGLNLLGTLTMEKESSAEEGGRKNKKG